MGTLGESGKRLYRIEIPSGEFGEHSTVFYLWLDNSEKVIMERASIASINVRRNAACAAIIIAEANTV